MLDLLLPETIKTEKTASPVGQTSDFLSISKNQNKLLYQTRYSRNTSMLSWNAERIYQIFYLENVITNTIVLEKVQVLVNHYL